MLFLRVGVVRAGSVFKASLSSDLCSVSSTLFPLHLTASDPVPTNLRLLSPQQHNEKCLERRLSFFFVRLIFGSNICLI